MSKNKMMVAAFAVVIIASPASAEVLKMKATLEGKSEVGGILLSKESWTALTPKPAGEWRDVELKGYESQDPVRAWQVPPPS